LIEPAPAGSVLSREAILALLDGPAPLITGLANPDEQVQPNGVDLSVEAVWSLRGAGLLGARAEDRQLPDRLELPLGPAGLHLGPGVYLVRLVEEVRLPEDLMALARPRSSLLRSGCAVHTAVWDAGYHGRSEVLLAVYAADGFRLLPGARILQMVFFRLTSATRGYAGRYQHEHLT
jgi:dUTP pyrophosphatase